MAIFRFFKMAAVRHLGFSIVGNFNFRSGSEAQYASSYQISRRSVEPFRRYCRFLIFQDGGRRYLGFWKFQILNGWDAQEGGTASVCQIFSKSLKPRLRYGDFLIFQDGGRPPSWIFKSWKFQPPVRFRGPICVIVPNFAKIGRTVPEIWPIFDFSRWRPPPSWIGFTRVRTTHEEYLVVFVTVHNLVVIGAVISTVCKF